MANGQDLLFRKRKYIFGSILLLLISVMCAAFSMTGSNDFDMARREVLLRRIGHELLLQSADSTSRVLPIKNIAENEYQIRFEHELSFKTDSLVNTVRHLLAKDPLTQDYVVNVLNCGSPGVAYAFAVSKNKKDDIVACKGRKQPKACYIINVKLKPAGTYIVKKSYMLGSLPFIAFVGFIIVKLVKPRNTLPNGQHTEMISLGAVLFDAKNRVLTIDQKKINLTGTETRLLRILALAPNETIERSRLQKEIWEDEGVIVGRSLDMFISKLRKKLEPDPNINIVVIRGKGYKLQLKDS